MTSITEKKLQDKLMKEENLEVKTTINLITQDTYGKNTKKNTIPDELQRKRKSNRITEPIQSRENYGKPKTQFNNNKPFRLCGR